MANTRSLARRLRNFPGDAAGSMSAELVIILPLLMAWVAMSLVFYDGYYQRVLNQKAAYTLADLLSRENSQAIGPTYIQGLDSVFDFLTDTEDSGGKIRVTLVYCQEHCAAGDPARKLNLDWSRSSSGTYPQLTQSDLNTSYLDQIPLAAKGDRQIVLETYLDYVPLLDIGLDDDIVMEMFVVTRPRFTPQLVWDDNA